MRGLRSLLLVLLSIPFLGALSPPAHAAPDPPTGLIVSAGVLSGVVLVVFSPPANTGGSPITGYTVTASPAGGVDTNAGTVTTAHTITGLSNGIAYTFTATAKNVNGTSVPSAPSGSATPSTVPGKPTAVTATLGNARSTVHFHAPASTGGAAITGYTVTSSPAGGIDSDAGTLGPTVCSISADGIEGCSVSHTVTGLVNGTAYTFTVRATNRSGSGSPSTPSASVTPSANALEADLAVTILGEFITTMAPNRAFQYVVSVHNNGPAAADGGVLVAPAVAGMTKIQVRCVEVLDGKSRCPDLPTVAQLEGAGLGLDFLQSGGTLNFTVLAYIEAASVVVQHWATATPPSGTLDPVPDNNTAAQFIVEAINYQGLWWNPSESGWGINLAHQGDIIFATWFTYDAQGFPWWLTAELHKTAHVDYTGNVTTLTGPPFDSEPFPAQGAPGGAIETIVGTMTAKFGDRGHGTIDYTVNGIHGAKAIVPIEFGPRPVCTWDWLPLAAATNYQDLWWTAGGTESGWGINFTHQGNIIFATWFTYGAQGKPWWVTIELHRTADGVYTGNVATLIGPPFNAVPFPGEGTPGGAIETIIGTATVTFADGNAATFAYTVNGVSQIKQITRIVFAAPGTVCQ
jgi:hypothetical protein